MSEIKKNIETCRGEDVLAEVSALTQDPHFGSLVTEAWTGKQPAQPYTSWIVEFKSLLILFLRKLYYTPLSLFSNTSIKDFIAGLQATIVTLQAAIASMLGDIATSYQKVSDKGGTLPQEQTSTNLPAAIESIPSGGAYGFLKRLGVPPDYLTEPNACVDADVEVSIDSQNDKVPFIYKSDITTNMWYNSSSTIRRILVADKWTGNIYQPLFRQYSLEMVIVGNGNYVVPFPTSGKYTFYENKSLKYLYFIFNCAGITGNITPLSLTAFKDCNCIREIRLRGVNTNINLSGWSALSNASMIYLLRNLGSDPHTVTLGSANLGRLNQTTEGQLALAYAQGLGWTIA